MYLHCLVRQISEILRNICGKRVSTLDFAVMCVFYISTCGKISEILWQLCGKTDLLFYSIDLAWYY